MTETPPPLPGLVTTHIVPKGSESDDGYIALIGECFLENVLPRPLVAAVIMNDSDVDYYGGNRALDGVVGAVLLLLICIIAVLLWCLSRHKGSYVTNETDDDEMDDDESVGSDTALQSREPLTKEDE